MILTVCGKPFEMGQGCIRLLFAVGAVLGSLAVSDPASASTNCASQLLADWRDGRIDGTYAVRCYRQALANLPEDVRIYSTASGDITRALQVRLTKVSAGKAAPGDGDGGHAVSPLLVLTICGAVLVAAGSAAVIVR
jgi:hypothetical protein